MNTQNPWATVSKMAGLCSRSSSARAQYEPTSAGSVKSRCMTGQPPTSRSIVIAQPTFIQTLLVCVSSSIEASPSVRPWPDCFTPPYGTVGYTIW